MQLRASVAPLELDLPPVPGSAEDDEAQPDDGTGPKPPLQLFPNAESESLQTRGEDGDPLACCGEPAGAHRSLQRWRTDATQPWRDPIATHLPSAGASGLEPVYPLVGGGTDDHPAVVEPPGPTFKPALVLPKPLVVPGDQYFELRCTTIVDFRSVRPRRRACRAGLR